MWRILHIRDCSRLVECGAATRIHDECKLVFILREREEAGRSFFFRLDAHCGKH